MALQLNDFTYTPQGWDSEVSVSAYVVITKCSTDKHSKSMTYVYETFKSKEMSTPLIEPISKTIPCSLAEGVDIHKLAYEDLKKHLIGAIDI